MGKNTLTIEINGIRKSRSLFVESKIKKVYWTDLKGTVITNAIFGDLVKFHIETYGMLEGQVTVKVYEEDNFRDNKFDTVKVDIKENKGSFEFRIQDEWKEKLEKWGEGDALEFYCEIDDEEKKDYLKVIKKDVIAWTPKVDADGTTYYIRKDTERFDNYNSISGFMLQYGYENGIDYGEGYNLVRKNEAGKLCVLGDHLKEFIGKDILKIDNRTVKPKDQQMFDHFLFAIDKSRSLGQVGLRPSDYFAVYKISGGLTGVSTFSWRAVTYEFEGKTYPLYVVDVATWNNEIIRTDNHINSTGSRLHSDGNYSTKIELEKVVRSGTSSDLGKPVSFSTNTENIDFLRKRIDRIRKIEDKTIELKH